MRYVLGCAIVFFIVGCCLPVAAAKRGVAVEPTRMALVIGNGAYAKMPLKNPVNDAQDMARTLKKLGFEVALYKNASLREFDTAIREFGSKLKQKGGVGLFYFAGHGMQVQGRNYLIPVDARIATESDVRFEAIDAGRVLGKMEDAGNQLNIVILDACRDNPFARQFRSASRGLARMDAPKGSLVAYATSPGSVAADGEGRNGIYTKYLLKHMQTPGLTLEKVLKRVRIDVLATTADAQIPWESSSLTGDFYFTPSEAKHKQVIPKAPATEPSQMPVSMIAKANAAMRSTTGPFLVDDFEDKDLFSDRLHQRWRIRKKGHPKTTLAIDPTSGAAGTTSSLKLTYRVKKKDLVQLVLGVFESPENTFDLSRFKKITLYLKGEKEASLISRPNKVGMLVVSYDPRVKTPKPIPAVPYWTKHAVDVRPTNQWQPVTFHFDDCEPALFAQHNITGYQPKPVLNQTIFISFFITSCCKRGRDESNTIWIDEVYLE